MIEAEEHLSKNGDRNPIEEDELLKSGTKLSMQTEQSMQRSQGRDGLGVLRQRKRTEAREKQRGVGSSAVRNVDRNEVSQALPGHV